MGYLAPQLAEGPPLKNSRRTAFPTVIVATLLLFGASAAVADETEVDPDPTDPTAQTADPLNGPIVTEVIAEPISLEAAAASKAVDANSARGLKGSGKIRPHILAKTENGSGGSPSASGCIRVTVSNKKYDYSGIDHLYTYFTWTDWCWNRSQKRVYNVATGTDFYIDNAGIGWEGNTGSDKYFYAWSTTSNSGYYHMHKGGFVNDFGPWTWGHSYPVNIIRSHSDGTWTWETSD